MKNGPLYYDNNGNPVWEIPCEHCGDDTEGHFHFTDDRKIVCDRCWNGNSFWDCRSKHE